ncbi:peptide deformylase [Sulfurospirillum barnesii]|uniref:Peptide deformylase n=1 Tax=Sulfurospirillum barnesii (strain ATCC 700032 / DSM 10660 / SES-3) TaxID=760154 RepID=I3XXH1_SULBS|nr:peptide deformylase [Sulfurospirillum barnesii]AFL68645.1 peptide deformylase [Sulfurospirillum barnesii SES-3]
MSQRLEISQLGSPVIRFVAKPVSDILAPEIQALIDAMIFTCKESKGVGIAAPQVGHSLSILIMASYPNSRYPYAPLMEPTALINPHIIAFSEEYTKDWEGCLSLPGIRGFVPRYNEIEVVYFDRTAKEQHVVFKDFLARLFQHEYDHLIGKVFIDRVESTHDIIMEKEYQRLMAEKEALTQF